MKIKTKKQLNLPQLIEWVWDNVIKDVTFYANENRTKRVYFNALGYAEFSDAHQFSSYDTFTIEVDEEITEDTVIPTLVEIYKCFQDSTEILKHEYMSINKVEDEDTLYFYILNDDLTMTLIWRDGKLVE